MKLTCLLIGEDSLLIPCASLLLEKNHRINWVITPVKSIQCWCEINNVPWVTSFHELPRDEDITVDYLFSIVSSKILTQDNLKIARMGTINYHNSLLPQYAGLNATTWAMINDEKSHGITWHNVNDGLDKGDIVLQRKFPIHANDSALMLNLRCFEEAIKGFSDLITAIETATLTSQKQREEERSYFARDHVLPDLGFINWKTASASWLNRLSRALSLGHYNNNVGLLKVCVEDSYLIVNEIELSHQDCESQGGGLILAIEKKGILVSTTSQPVFVKSFVTPYGHELTIDDVVRDYGLHVNYQLKLLDQSLILNGRYWYSKALQHEQYWVYCLKKITEHTVFSDRVFAKNESINELTPLRISDFSTQPSMKSSAQGQYLLASILIYLYRLNDYESITVFLNQAPVFDKDLPCRGLVSNLLPMTFDFNDETTCSTAFDCAGDHLNSVAAHEFYLSDVFARYPALASLKLGSVISIGFSDKPVNLPKNSIIHFEINPTRGELFIYHRVNCHYREGELTPIMANLTQHLSNILGCMLTNPHQLINQFCFLTEEEQKQLVDWGVGQEALLPGNSIHELFERQARLSPESPAIYYGNSMFSYQQLGQQAEKIAGFIHQLQLPAQTLLGIYLHRSVEMLALVLGILKANCVYVPLDTKYPALKIENIVIESKISHLFATGEYFDQLQHHFSENITQQLQIYDVKKIITHLSVGETKRAAKAELPDNKLAYIMFTSGTTGTPKGVMVTHQNVINYCHWFTQTTRFTAESIIDFSSSLAFDLSIPCTLAPLLVGGAIALCEDNHKVNPQHYLQHLQRYQISHVELTPGYLEMLLQYPQEISQLSQLRYVLLGADMVHSEEVDKWLSLSPSSQIINEYGPTETTVSVTSYFVKNRGLLHEATVPIGRPGFNSACYLLDKSLNLCPIGMRGELYVGGAQVTLGYFDKPLLTASKFLKITINKQVETLYKTGDLACWLPEGYLQFFGRNDHQVKIQGYRIELPAIESMLMKIEGIQQVVVVIRQGAFKDKYLRAYLVSDDRSLTRYKIKEFLQLHIPSYMHPKEFCVVDTIPLKENEKIDFDTLEKQSNQLLTFKHEPINFEVTDTQRACIKIWQKVFQTQAISLDDDFFALGGDSLLALQIISSLKTDYNTDIPLAILFEYPTISRLATALDNLIYKKIEALLIGDVQQSATIIKLSSGSYKIPLFLVHPVGGTLFWYQQLAQHLDGKYTIYGIQDQSVDGHARRFDCLEAMADYYLQELSTIYQGKKYCIGGASFGATVAFAMAQQLIKSGKSVEFLGLFDGWAKYPPSLMQTNTIQILTQHQHAIEVRTSTYLQELEEYRKKLLLEYRLPRLNTQVTLFKAMELWESMASMDDPFNGWRPYVAGDITIHPIPGTHETMFFSPNVEQLANQIHLEPFSASLGS